MWSQPHRVPSTPDSPSACLTMNCGQTYYPKFSETFWQLIEPQEVGGIPQLLRALILTADLWGERLHPFACTVGTGSEQHKCCWKKPCDLAQIKKVTPSSTPNFMPLLLITPLANLMWSSEFFLRVWPIYLGQVPCMPHHHIPLQLRHSFLSTRLKSVMRRLPWALPASMFSFTPSL